MAIIHSYDDKARDKNVKHLMKKGKTYEEAQNIARSVQQHAVNDEYEERKIERITHERFKYGR